MRSSLGWLCRWHWWRLCSTSIIQHLYSASFRILQAEWNKAEKKSRTIWLQFEDRLHSALKNDSIWHLTCGFNLAVALCMFAYRRMENNGALLPEHHAFVMHIFKGIRRIPNGEKNLNNLMEQLRFLSVKWFLLRNCWAAFTHWVLFSHLRQTGGVVKYNYW